MTFPSDDLTPQLRRRPVAAVRNGQARILSWDPETFANTVNWRGTILTNIPVQSGTEALTYQPGDIVILEAMDWSGGKGAVQYAIKGRYIVPGTGAADRAIAFLQTQLAKQISGDVLAERVHAATIADSDLIDTDTYDDIATVGPTVAEVPVTGGVLIVWPSASIAVAANSGDSFSAAAYMGYAISGTGSVSPSDERAARLTLITTDEAAQVITRPAGAFVHTGLTAGTYTVRAKYRVETGDENQASANDRTLVVMGI